MLQVCGYQVTAVNVYVNVCIMVPCSTEIIAILHILMGQSKLYPEIAVVKLNVDAFKYCGAHDRLLLLHLF